MGDDPYFDKEISSRRNLTLWYDQPATQWVEALPIGNGRLGAMVFGESTSC
ncbi:MAG TPA: glycoside hydrolase N-terminal domain-containing protein [Pyrinomonadaceae bacterium]|jgi:alpha-L-fucosidase 2|nr:glycoside hydrolase N-terminal domain-containing protein [Pyrinomonadaceae bacterium]